MIIAELNSRFVLIDDSDNFIEYLFMDKKAPNYLGWPNEQTENGTLSRPSTLAPYKFNSPHGITVNSIEKYMWPNNEIEENKIRCLIGPFSGFVR